MVSPNAVIFFAISFLFFTSSVSSKKPDANGNANALLAFKSKADPHNKLWFSSTASSFCRWTGVECSQAKPVRFVVEDMNLGGIFPPNTLNRLDQLRVLSLRNNSLTGPIPDLSGLLNLKVLFLSQNYFAGSIPASVSSLHRLKTLDLSDNHLSGPVPKELGNLDRLYTLRLESNWLNGSIPALNQSSLRIFNVSKNSLTGPIPVTETLLRMETSSFWWNPGLCGEIVHTECREMQHFFGRASPPPPTEAAEAELGENAANNVVLTHPKTEKSNRKTAIVIGFSSAGFVFLCSLICLALATRKRAKESSTTKLRNYPAGESSIDAHIEAVMRIEEENHELEEKIRRVQEGVQIAGMGKSGNLVFCGGDQAAENYTLEKLMRASAELLGRGTLAATYRAVLDSGAVVCVKRLDAAKMAGTSREVFEGHMQAVGGLRHPNLVPLRAYFQARDERLLIYDYQPNGSLFSLIHCSKSARAKPLHWTSCLKIAEDVAQGLSYIHQAWRLVHGNLKSSNVLLGSDFEACLADYCLSALTTAATGDHREEEATAKSDVYSFGILVLELLSGKLPSEIPALEGGAEEVMRWVKLNRDGDDESGEDGNKVEMLAEVGVACSVSSPEQRPTMWQVLKMIQEIKEAVVMEDL